MKTCRPHSMRSHGQREQMHLYPIETAAGRYRSMLMLICLLAMWIILCSLPSAALAETEVSGTISEDTTWTLANSPYIVSSVTVAEGVTLTIDPGTVVKFQGYDSRLTVNGTLCAEGTAESEIVFTSLKDDTYGGDTNNDGDGSSPAAGDWDKIHFSATSTQNLMRYCFVQYAGSYGSGGIYAEGSSCTIDHCTNR